MILRDKLKLIFEELKKIDSNTQDEKVEYFLKLLSKNKIYLQECISPQEKMLQNFEEKSFFSEIAETLKTYNEEKKIETFEDLYYLLKALLSILSDTAAPRIKNRDPILFDLHFNGDAYSFNILRQKWENIANQKKHSFVQRRITSIIVRLMNIAKFQHEASVQRLVSILLEIPENIADDNVLQELELICDDGEKWKKIYNDEKTNNFADVIKGLQDTLNESTQEIEELNQMRNKIVEQGEEFTQQKGENLLNIANRFYEKINSLNQSIYKKENHIKDLNEQLYKVTILLQQMEEKTKTDTLTKVYNRCYLEELLWNCEAQFMEEKNNYSVLFFDIDGFKEVNDYYGHLAGDELLSSFADILKNNSRASDIIGRYGGDEFLIIMPKTDLKIAKDVALRICNAVSEEKVTYHDEKLHCSTSIGVVERKDFATKEEMLRKADELLYKAKKNGRNQVQWE
ncbi:GGDEF domain-containing protein [Helicobacter anatolicus]|uniref:GGDEF domain-containing protein n=1 Tax=Helicobacter anatolicus TaxID=2905874 RepID=UPI001E2CA10B|nr:GGDEF domain-containing protein [Helicobacter anatolicus]MCE3039315.1 GGDEF domain-containing protein [Helicobacter anatolicus]